MPSLSIGDVTVAQGNSGTSEATFVVTLTPASGKTISVSATTSDGSAVAGEDYTVTGPTTLTFAPGVTSRSFVVPVIGDTANEVTESFTVALSSAVNATLVDAEATGTIQDNDWPRLSIADVTLNEADVGSTDAVFVVSLTGPSSETVTVDYSVSAGTASSDGVSTVSSSAPVSIPLFGSATPYPSSLSVSLPGTIQKLSVTLSGFTHSYPADVDVLLVGPNGQSVVLMSDAGGSTAVSGAGLVFDDTGPALTTGAIGSGTFRPTNLEGSSDSFASPAPGGPYGTTLSVFNGTLAAGVWKLYVVDDAGGDLGSLSGWSLTVTGPGDFVPGSGTLTFPPSGLPQTQSILVPVLGDSLEEPAETFFVDLSNPANAVLLDGHGEGTIASSDGPPLSIADACLLEGDEGSLEASLVVSLGAHTQTVTADYAVSAGTASEGDDYSAVEPGTLTFPPSESPQTARLTVPVLGDLLDEADETFVVTLSDAVNASLVDAEATGTITDDDAEPSLSIDDLTVAEGDSGMTDASFTVTLSSASGKTVSVSAATSDASAVAGQDYEATGPTRLTFAPGVTRQSFAVPVIGDTTDEANQAFTATLSDAANAGAADAEATGTITDDDAEPSLSIGDVSLQEGDSGASDEIFTVTLTPASGKTVSVSASTSDGSSVAGEDYTATGPTTLRFAPGVTTQSFAVSVIGDLADEATEAFTVTLSGAVNAGLSDSEAAGTITDDDAEPSLSIGDLTATEGDSGTSDATFTVTLTPASGNTVSVSAATSDGSAGAGQDYEATGPTTLSFDPGVTSRTFAVPVAGDTTDEANETFTATLSSAVNAGLADAEATGTITDDDAEPSLSIGDLAVTEGDSGTSEATFTVTLTPGSGKTVSVSASTSDGTAVAGEDYTATGPTTLTFAPGVTTGSFVVPVIGDTIDEADEAFSVTLSSAANAGVADAEATGTINDGDAEPSLSIGDLTVTEGDSGTSDATFTLTLTPASGKTVSVTAATSDGSAAAGEDYTATGPTTLTFAPGATTQSFAVSVIGGLADEVNEAFTVTLSGAVNAGLSDSEATGTITDDDAEPSLSIGDLTVTEGDSGTSDATFTVTLAPASGKTVNVSAATSDGSAGAGQDYEATRPTTLTFAPGVTTRTFVVPVIGDTTDESNETFRVTLSGAVNAGLSDAEATGSVTDDDLTPCALAVGTGAANPQPFLDTYAAHGGQAQVGCPATSVHASGDGTLQDFSSGSGGDGALLLRGSTATAFLVQGATWVSYSALGGPTGWLGYPLSDETPLAPSSISGAQSRATTFVGGGIVLHTSGPLAGQVVHLGSASRARWLALGSTTGALGLPVSDEAAATASPRGTQGRLASFEAGHIHLHSSGLYPGRAFETHSGIDARHVATGGSGGCLGFPIGDQTGPGAGGLYRNDFEGGVIAGPAGGPFVESCTNLLYNGSMEVDNDAVTTPDGWTGTRLVAADGRVSTASSNGTWSFRFTGNGKAKQLTQTLVATGPARTLDLRLGYQTSSATGTGKLLGKVVVFYTDGTKSSVSLKLTAGTHGWLQAQKPVNATKSYRKIQVQLVYGKPAGSAWFDEVRLEKRP